MEKKLYKSRKNQVVDGVCAGIAMYLNLDPSLVRILWILFTLAGGAGILAYIVCMCVLPRQPKKKKQEAYQVDLATEEIAHN